MSNVNRLDNMEKELVERVFVYDRQGEKAPIGIVKINAYIAGDIYSDEDLDDDGYVLLGITRLADGRYVELYRCLGDYGVRGFLISEEQALLLILEYEKEEILEQKKFQDLKVKYDSLAKEMED